MPKRTLIEHRPWLVVSLAAAIGFWLLRDSAIGGLFIVTLKGVSVGALAVYALRRRSGTSGTMLAAVMALASIGDVTLHLWGETIGGGVFLASHLLAIALYLRHRRAWLTASQRLAAVALLLFVPLVALLLSGKVTVMIYAVSLGVMAAAAWTSSFGRYRVGMGALLFVASDLLIFANIGGRVSDSLSDWLVWPLYYIGQLMIVTGVERTLRAER